MSGSPPCRSPQAADASAWGRLAGAGAVQVRHLVLDEADRLLETGNRAAIMKIFQLLRTDGVGDKRLQVVPGHPDGRALDGPYPVA